MLSLFKSNESNPPLELKDNELETVIMEYDPSSIQTPPGSMKKTVLDQLTNPAFKLLDKVSGVQPQGYDRTDYERRDLHTRKLVEHALSIKTLSGKEGIKQAAKYLANNKVDPKVATRVLLGPTHRRRGGDSR